MAQRFIVLVVGALLVLTLCAPAVLAVSVTGMTPSIGEGGVPLTCTVTGGFRISDATTTASAPRFMLSNFYGTIAGTTGAWDASTATVTFPLPLNADPGTYTLQVSQDSRTGQLPVATETNTLPNAFKLYWVPAITSVSPPSVVAGNADWTIFVDGARFINGGLYEPHSIVRYNGMDLPTTYRTSAQLSALIPGALLAVPGTAAISVFNSSGTPLGAYTGAWSAPFPFTITGPVPAIASIDPSSAVAGAPGLDLVVIGRDFLTGADGAVVLWSGTPLVTTRDSATHLTAAVPAALLAAPGVATVSVRNGAAGAPVSDGKPFTIGNPVPSVTSVTPSSLWAGSVQTDVVLAVTGAGFVSGARVVLNGVEKAGTAFAGATQLTTPLTPADMAAVGTIAVTVRNPPFPPGIAGVGSVALPVRADTTEPTVTVGGADDQWHRKPVTLTFTATDPQSGVQKVEFRAPPAVGAWTAGAGYTVPVSSQGSIPVLVQAFDWCNHVGTAQVTVKIDATRPTTQTLGNVTVKRGRTAVLKYRVTEPSGLSPTADVVIVVKKSGATVATFTEPAVPVNAAQGESFTCTLGKGRYTWSVYATDLAGNKQKNVAQAGLTVK
jgi:hypothetical protein